VTSEIDTTATTEPDTNASTAQYVPPEDLSADSVRQSVTQILRSLTQDAIPWQAQLAAVPHGSDFDLQDPRGDAAVLDRLKATADVLGKALTEGTAGQAVHAGLSYLAEPCEALAKDRSSRNLDALQAAFVKHYRHELDSMGGAMGKLPSHLRTLSEIAAKGAADCDPKAASRIKERMRTLGNATLRQIDDALVAAVSREERRRYVMLRDEMKDWIKQRNARVEASEAAVAELAVRGGALQNEGLIQSNRMARAAELAAGCAKPDGLGRHVNQASADAGRFAARMRAVLLGARIDVTAVLQGASGEESSTAA